MIDEGQFVSAIDMIAEKLGIAVTEIFNIFVHAQVTLGVLMILQCVAVLVLCVMTYFVTMKLISGSWTYNGIMEKAKERDKDYDEDAESFFMFTPVVVGVLSVILWGFVVGIIADGLVKILCPEYSAIIEIIRMVT